MRPSRMPAGHADLGRIFDLGTAFSGSRALFTAVELGVFTELASGPLQLEELRDRIGIHPRGARDFFDALVALGMLDRDGTRYRNTPASDRFLDRAKPTYVGPMLEDFDAYFYTLWGTLKEALRTGQPQFDTEGSGDVFSALYSDENRLREYLRGMTGVSLGPGRVIAERFPFQQYRTFLDIGCAEGALPVQVALTHPNINGGGFDLPQVGPYFEEYVASFGLSERLAFHAGDFLNGPLPSADVLAMGHILQDWDLETKLSLLEKAYAALPEGGALIVHEAIIDDERRSNVYGLLSSLAVLMMTPGGFDFTGTDCQQWMRSVGFRETWGKPLIGPDAMVVAIK